MRSSIVVEKLKNQKNSPFAFLYLAYKEKQETELSVPNLLGCLANQLIDQLDHNAPLPPCVQDVLEKHRENGHPGVSQLQELLSELASSGTSFVIEALEEFDPDQRQKLLVILRKIGRRLLVTSRDKPIEGFEEVEVEAKDQDIHSFVCQKCYEDADLPVMMKRNPDLLKEIKKEITNKAAGM